MDLHMRTDVLVTGFHIWPWGCCLSAGITCLQDFSEFLHDVNDRAVAGPVNLTEYGPELLHCFGSGSELPAGHAWLLQHLGNAQGKVRGKAEAIQGHNTRQARDQTEGK